MDMVCPADVFCAYCKRKYRFCCSPDGDGRDEEAECAADGPSPPALFGHIVPIGSASAKLTGTMRVERSTPSPAPSTYHTAGSHADGGAQSRECAQLPSHHDASANPYARPRLRLVGVGARDRACVEPPADCETGSTTPTLAAEAAATAACSSLAPPGAHVSSASAAGAIERPQRGIAGSKRRAAREGTSAAPPADDVAAPLAKRSRADGAAAAAAAAAAGGASVRPRLAAERRLPRRSGARAPAAEALSVLVCWAQCDACEAWRVTGRHDVSKWSTFKCATVGRSCGQPDDAPPAVGRAVEEGAAEAVRRAALRARYDDSLWPQLDADRYFGLEYSDSLLAALAQLGREPDAAARCVAAAAGAGAVSTAATGAGSAEAAAGARPAGAHAGAARSPAEGGGGGLSDGEQTTDSHALMHAAQDERIVHSEEDADSPRGGLSDGEQTTARRARADEPPAAAPAAGPPPRTASSVVLQLDAAIERRGAQDDGAARPAAAPARGALVRCRFVPPADARARAEAGRLAASEAELLALADAAETPSWSLDALLPAAGDDQDGLWALRRRQRSPSPSPRAARGGGGGGGGAVAADAAAECESDGSLVLDSFLTILALHPTGARHAWAHEAREADADADAAPPARADASSWPRGADASSASDSLELRLLTMEAQLDELAAETAATRAQLCAAALADRQASYATKCAAGEVLVADECEMAPTPPAAQSPRETQAAPQPCAFPALGRGAHVVL